LEFDDNGAADRDLDAGFKGKPENIRLVDGVMSD
jgi:hypothetical protein